MNNYRTKDGIVVDQSVKILSKNHVNIMRLRKELIGFAGLREFLVAAVVYVTISVFFLIGLIVNRGTVAQGDWNIPITPSAAQGDFRSLLFVWSNNGFGDQVLVVLASRSFHS